MICIACDTKNSKPFSPDLMSYCQSLPHEFVNILNSTEMMLKKAGNYIISQLDNGRDASICFVCQHNSRKSHLGQIWTQMACLYYGINNVNCYSGGTTPTYVNSRIIKALNNTGFRISRNDDIIDRPKYYLNFGNPSIDFELFSKRYDHQMNTNANYIAISLCNNPEECCPITYGADEQLIIPYDDLQKYDNSSLESVKYDEQCRRIARDMFCMMKFVNSKDNNHMLMDSCRSMLIAFPCTAEYLLGIY